MTDLAAAFPTRPLRIKRTGVWPGIWSYGGGLLLLGIGVFMGVTQIPGIVNDVLIAQDPVVVADALITDGECSVSRAVFVDCSAHVAYEVKSKPFERDIELMFLDFGGQDYEVDVVRSEARPQLATLSLGLDMLWNRIIVSALFVLFLAAGGLALIANGWRADRQRRVARQGSVWQPVAVGVTRIDKVVGGKTVQFQYGVNKKNRPLLAISRFGRKEEPFWLDPENGTALAVTAAGTGRPVLLDGGLQRLDLTDAERQAILKTADA